MRVHDVTCSNDDIHLNRSAVVLIAQTPDCVLAGTRLGVNSRMAWGAHEPDRTPGRDRRGQRVREGWASGRPRAFNACTFHAIAVSAKPPQRAPNWNSGSLRSLVPAHPRDRHRRCSGMDRRHQGGARAGRTSWRRSLRRPGIHPTSVSCERVTASTSSSPRGSCSPTWTWTPDA